MGNTAIHLISSMATRQVLGELADAWQQNTGHNVRVESVGGVDGHGMDARPPPTFIRFPK